MKDINYYFSLVFIACIACLGWSCVNENAPCENELPGKEDNGNDKYIMLRIGTLSLDNSPEMIKCLRIIVTNNGGTENPESTVIEYNDYIELKNPSAAATFDYTWVNPTDLEGSKNVYVIANEESIEGLSETLEGFEVSSDPANFLNWMLTYYFEPNYSVSEEGSIFLPYTSESRNVTTDTDFNIFVTDIYMVPAATKFIFNFYNSRHNPVTIKEISVNPINTSNYLFAHVGEKDQYKTFEGERLFWVEWLEKVAKESLKYPDFTENENFNNLYGWISDYRLPNENNSEYVFFDAEEEAEEESYDVPGATFEPGDTKEDEKITPGQLSIGPFYLPESKNEMTYEETAQDGTVTQYTRQTYNLTMFYEDGQNLVPEFKDIPISNLKALFRDTYVIINIRMYEGDVDIYAETYSWTVKSINGWVEEGNAPSNNPFLK